MKAYQKRAELEMLARKELAWCIAHLSRIERFPKYEKWMANDTKKPPIPPEEFLERLRAKTAALPKKRWDEWQAR